MTNTTDLKRPAQADLLALDALHTAILEYDASAKFEDSGPLAKLRVVFLLSLQHVLPTPVALSVRDALVHSPRLGVINAVDCALDVPQQAPGLAAVSKTGPPAY